MADIDAALPQELTKRLSQSDREFIAQALGNGADPAEIAQYIERARQSSMGLEDYHNLVYQVGNVGPGAQWQGLVSSLTPAQRRAAISAGSENAALDQGWDLGSNPAIAGMDLANLNSARKLTTAPATDADPASVTDFATKHIPMFMGNARDLGAAALRGEDSITNAAKAAGSAALPLAIMGSYGNLLSNPLGALARTSLAMGTQPGTQGLGIAYPGQSGAASFMDGLTSHDRRGIVDIANKYGVRVGGYSDPQNLIDAMAPSINVRRDAMLAAGASQEDADAWARDELNRFQTELEASGGVEGLRNEQYADTAGAVAGRDGAQGTIDTGYQSGLSSNAFMPAALAKSQLEAWKRLPGASADAAKALGGVARGALRGADGIVRYTNGLPQLPGRTLPTISGAAKAGAGGAAAIAKPLLGTLGAGLSAAVSLPSYLQAARNEAGLYDTATDPQGQNADSLAHQAATEGTRYGSLALQALGGEAAIPGAIVAGTNAASAGLANTALGQGLAKLPPGTAKWWNLPGRIAQTVRNVPGALNAVRAAGLAGSAGGLLGAGAKGARRALPGFALGSMAIDAGQNLSAATRSMQSYFSGDPRAQATVDLENRAMADNADWLRPDASFMGNVGSVISGALRPTTTARELLGAKDQILEARRSADEGADALAAQQQLRAYKPLQTLSTYRQQLAASGADTSAVDNQIAQVRQQLAAAPSQQAWSDVGKWQNGMVGWAVNPFGDHRNRGELGFAEQYAKMDDATKARVDEIVAGVARGTVDPERARVALGMPAMQEWSPADMQDPNKAAANQRWVLNQAEIGAGRNGYKPWQISGQWQNPAAAAKAAAQPAPTRPPAPTPSQQQPVQAPQIKPPSANTPVAAARPPQLPPRMSAPFASPAQRLGPMHRGLPV